jgi:hypothetical protein
MAALVNGMTGLITVQVLAVTRDRHGDRVITPAGSIAGCSFAPAASNEDTDNRAQTIETATVYCGPTDVVVTSQHKIRTPDNREWDVDGDPQWWANPFTTAREGGVIQLRRVTG